MLFSALFFLIPMQNAVGKEYIKIVPQSPLEYTSPSKDCNTNICKELIGLIYNSKDTIDFAIYGFRGQKEILNALINAKNRGVKIRGIIDKNIKGKNYYSDTYLVEKNFKQIKSDYNQDIKTKKLLQRKKNRKDKCKRPKGHDGPLQCFEGQGYASKKDFFFQGDIMHNKFFIIDNQYVWTGSANISDTGTGGYNANVVAIIKSNFIANKYLIEFEQMFIDEKFHRAKQKLKKTNLQTDIDGQKTNLYFSPQGYAMYRGVIPLIREAKKSIDISMFFLTHNNLSKELMKAKNRGVSIRVIIDATGASNDYSKHEYLRKKGISVKVENWGGKMHMKSALVDNRHLIVGSMNWTHAGESKNDENTIIIHNFKNASIYKNFFDSMWQSIPNKWLYSNPQPESIDSKNSCSDGIDNNFNEKVDFEDKKCKGD